VLPEEDFRIEIQRDGKNTLARLDELASEEERREFRKAYKFTIRSAALDIARCVLPASTLTNLGISGNGRFYTLLLTTLKSSNLEEFRERGAELERELNKTIPTYIKRNKANPEWKIINKAMREIALRLFRDEQVETPTVLLVPNARYIDQVVSASLFPYTQIPLTTIQERVSQMTAQEKQEILDTYRGNRQSRRDRTDRGLEAGYPITFDLLCTFAEYRDLERHRMMTQQRQRLTTRYGFFVPPTIIELGLQDKVLSVVERSNALYEKLVNAGMEEEAQYPTLFNHLVRSTMGMNLRENQHLTELRSQKNGHAGYRYIAQQMARLVIARDPWAETFLGFVDYSDPDNKIARAIEQGRIAGKNLRKGIAGDAE
jgi:thymidylate synthase ThyX